MQIPGSIPMPYAAAADSTDGSGNGSQGQDSGTITANDFLTLLVTELKNQDPTANTDPNAYVDQLVQVNSLQQLIQINQNTTGAASGTQPSSSGS
jgi:flagellar basal-body rod modification protein FlgD